MIFWKSYKKDLFLDQKFHPSIGPIRSQNMSRSGLSKFKCRSGKLVAVSHPYFVVVIPILAIFVIFFLFVFVFVIYLINMKTTSVTVPADEITN